MGAVGKNEFGGLARRLESRLSTATNRSAQDLISEMQAGMLESKSGTHWPGQPHVSSAPGESPATQSGDLLHSFQVRPRGATDWDVFTANPYAADLEYGSAARHLAPRPFLIPGAHAVAPAHWRRLLRAVQGKDPV